MTTVNEAATNLKQRKWYNNYKLPLLPELVIKQANEHNTSSFSFHWLFFKIWSLDAPSFELAFVFDTHWGIGITALLPYLRIIICIPCPNNVSLWTMKYLWRKTKYREQFEED